MRNRTTLAALLIVPAMALAQAPIKVGSLTLKDEKTLGEIDRVVTRNGIWVGRTIGLGVMSPEEAVNYGLSGPMLRPGWPRR